MAVLLAMSVAQGHPVKRGSSSVENAAFGFTGRPHPAPGLHVPSKRIAPSRAPASFRVFRVVASCSASQKPHTPPWHTAGFRMILSETKSRRHPLRKSLRHLNSRTVECKPSTPFFAMTVPAQAWLPPYHISRKKRKAPFNSILYKRCRNKIREALGIAVQSHREPRFLLTQHGETNFSTEAMQSDVETSRLLSKLLEFF